jgi:hypothetical protein
MICCADCHQELQETFQGVWTYLRDWGGRRQMVVEIVQTAEHGKT